LKHTGASRGHLWVVEGTDIRRVAASNGDPPPELESRVRDMIRRLTDAEAERTKAQTLHHEDGTVELSRYSYSEALSSHMPVVLSAREGDRLLVVGIAAISIEAEQGRGSPFRAVTPEPSQARPCVAPPYTVRAMANPNTAPSLPELHVTQQDLDRLSEVVEQYSEGPHAKAAEALEVELERARIVPQDQVPPDVVTMRSRAVCLDLDSGRQRELMLVYPGEANPEEGKVSVLAPVGLALLGLRVGDTIRWPMGGGRQTTLKLLEVRFQPEAAGEMDL
jgi:regulator of nucleoside diphosphate kinase